MSDKSKRDRGRTADELFDFAGSDPGLLKSGRIPDPQPEHTALFRWLARLLGTLEEFLRARGGVGLRMVIRLFWGLIAAIGIFLLVGPIINEPMDLDEVIEASQFEDVEWVAQDAGFDFAVERADDGSFGVTATERYTANFVNGDGQRIVRSFITELHGHDTEFELISAAIDGEPADVTVRERATTTEIELRLASGEPLSGTRVIEVEYELRHLIDDDATATDQPVDEWRWPVFGPSWTQGTSGLEVSVTLPHELDDALTRKPYATVGWLLVSGNVWLEPEDETSEVVRYSFTNSDNLPPNSHAMVRFTFADGTFTQPPTTALFWVFTWGPLLPLAVLVVVMLFALAARRIVWADSAGEPWFVARSDPPNALSPNDAAALMRKRRHAELVGVLGDLPARAQRDGWLRRVAEAARRAGRLGSIPSFIARPAAWANTESAVKWGLRWKPDSYVRDSFILAPIALSLVQFGILRQLAEQHILLIVWWPTAIVAASTIVAVIAVWAVTRRRPLTREGALAMQQLKGIDVWARGTRLLDRGPLDDPLLPYAVLFEDPRKAGDAVHELAVRESRDADVAKGWRTSRFLSAASMLGFMTALALFAGSIVLVALAPTPYSSDKFLTWPSSDESGSIWTQVEGFEIDAELSRDDSGAAQLDVVETFTVGFTAGGGSVPQFEREWPRKRFGQDLGLEVASVTIDGDTVPYKMTAGEGTVKMSTQLVDVIEGKLPVTVRYSLAAPAVDVKVDGAVVQQVRWTAMNSYWEDEYYTNRQSLSDGRSPVRPLRVQVTLAADLADEVRESGWIGSDYDADRVPYERGAGIRPWVYENHIYLEDETSEDAASGDEASEDAVSEDAPLPDRQRYDVLIGDESVRSDGAEVYTLDADAVQSRFRDHEHPEAAPGPYEVNPELNLRLGQYELDQSTDLGAVFTFDRGTFTNVTEGGYTKHRLQHSLPLTGLTVGTVLIILAAGRVIGLRLRRKGTPGTPHSPRTPSMSSALTVFGTLTVLAVAQSVVFWWAIGSMPGSSAAIPSSITLSLVMWAGVIGTWIVHLRASSSKDTAARTKK